MSESRDTMIAALKKIVVLTLREEGFRGSFPHFRRQRDEQLDLLTFQFSQRGGGFVVEIASSCSAAGFIMRTGELVSPNQARVRPQPFRGRLRLGVRLPPNHRDHWFRYEPDGPSVYSETAMEVLPLKRSQAENFWRRHEHTEQ